MHCLAHGIDVPGDLALAGFNDLPFLSALPKRITTTRTPRYEMGQRAAAFVGKANESPKSPIEIKAELIEGDTT